MSQEVLAKLKLAFDEELERNVSIVLARWKNLHQGSENMQKLKAHLEEQMQEKHLPGKCNQKLHVLIDGVQSGDME